MNEQNMAVREGMSVDTLGRRTVVRAMLLMACPAVPGHGTVQRTGAEDVSAAGTANVLTCESAGREATVSSNQTANGHQTVSVECNGGYLYGWNSLHDTDFGTCNRSTETIIDPYGAAKAPTGGLGLEPTTSV